uniref:NADH-ubiquinone oxidoreductase chain 1 n=1 Tax=Schmidtea mediterranea TaxID=79327 RepID=A0A0B4VK88_SCHMD|nr:NADH dehydrogenase subunit 1 [Schmidtea mediterranea]
MLFGYLFIWVSMLVCVIYITMLERKIMSYIQTRKGPNKVGFLGLATAFADALKLLVKGFGVVSVSSRLLFSFSPLLTVYILFFVWCLLPLSTAYVCSSLGFLIYLCFNSLNVFSVLGSGWSCNSKYTLLGSIRGASQVISYEALLLLVLIFPLALSYSLSFLVFCYFGYWYLLLFFPLSVLFLVVGLAETNRSPFDFSEGESELVSGFNTEYGSMEFACLFLGEYGQIVFICIIWFLLYCSTSIFFLNMVGGILISFSFILFRSTFPRFRYDLLMNLAWNWGLLLVSIYFLYLLFF